jgi:hypothetical protein
MPVGCRDHARGPGAADVAVGRSRINHLDEGGIELSSKLLVGSRGVMTLQRDPLDGVQKMKSSRFFVGASLLGACLLSVSLMPQGQKPPTGFQALLAGSPLSQLGTVSAKVVRVDYMTVAWGASTECHLTNTSVSQPLMLGEVYLLGPGGVSAPVITYTGLLRTVVPPLGRVTLQIDNRIPGVQPWTGGRPARGGVTSAVFTWAGPYSAANLTAVITDCYLGNCEYSRATVVETGFDIWP